MDYPGAPIRRRQDGVSSRKCDDKSGSLKW